MTVLVMSHKEIDRMAILRDLAEKRLKVAFVVEETGLPRRTVQYAINKLVKKEFLQRLGQGAGTRYQLIF